ncbi:hypothetical protein EV363DRAFT_1192970 [Boletus edulis]|nr:hypothetical protein EV363DRAFT_1192970 [Boletus edulis]
MCMLLGTNVVSLVFRMGSGMMSLSSFQRWLFGLSPAKGTVGLGDAAAAVALVVQAADLGQLPDEPDDQLPAELGQAGPFSPRTTGEQLARAANKSEEKVGESRLAMSSIVYRLYS